jgi:hypothetical protein
MRLKKWIRGTLSVAIGCMAAFPCFSCGDSNDNGGAKDTVITESEKITMTEFSQPVSLLPLYVESYLAADPQDLVTSYVVGGNRLDKGAPVTIEYSFKDIGSSTILEEKLEISSAEDFSTIEQTLYFAPRRSSVNIYNLQTDTTYFYRVTVALDNGETHVKTSSLQTQDTIRFIALDGACNVRDIGGWQTQSGKKIKSRLLYRGSEIDGGKNTGHADFCLTEKGITQLRALGIKTDFDLRSSENKVSEHSILGEDVARTFYNAPQYQFYFNNSNKETTRKIFSDLAKPEAYPVYLHCTHGVDRAGSTVLLLESLLGVAKEDLIRDYELSAFYYAHVNRNTLNGGGSVTLMLEKLETFEGETLADKTENFLLSVGVTQAEIDTIRSVFLG